MLQSLQDLNLPHDCVDVLVEIFQGDSLHRDKLTIVQVEGSINDTELPLAYAIAKLLQWKPLN